MYNPTDKASPLGAEEVVRCPLCGGKEREVLYAGLEDRLYGVAGAWTYKRCDRCTLILLDPRPPEAEIGKAYAVYPTHSRTVLPRTLLRRLRSYAREGYLANKFGYAEGVGLLRRLAGRLIYLHPGQREQINGSIMYLPARLRGKVLDVGAGAGEVLSELRRLGWEVEGVDPDARAAENVRRELGLDVQTGTLEEQRFSSDSYDTVIMSHVIEHVHDPVGLLRECRRVLKPGGVLVVATPNAESLGHRLFGTNWRVLEPPRHLTIFSLETLARAASEAGLSPIELQTTTRGADGIFIESHRLGKARTEQAWQRPASRSEKLVGQLFQYVESALVWLRPNQGEEVLMMTSKQGSE